jgi:hypothetical protein
VLAHSTTCHTLETATDEPAVVRLLHETQARLAGRASGDVEHAGPGTEEATGGPCHAAPAASPPRPAPGRSHARQHRLMGARHCAIAN